MKLQRPLPAIASKEKIYHRYSPETHYKLTIKETSKITLQLNQPLNAAHLGSQEINKKMPQQFSDLIVARKTQTNISQKSTIQTIAAENFQQINDIKLAHAHVKTQGFHTLEDAVNAVLTLTRQDLEYNVTFHPEEMLRIIHKLGISRSLNKDGSEIDDTKPFDEREKRYFWAERKILESADEHFGIESSFRLPTFFTNFHKMTDPQLASIYNNLTAKEKTELLSRPTAGGTRAYYTFKAAAEAERELEKMNRREERAEFLRETLNKFTNESLNRAIRNNGIFNIYRR